MAQAPAPSDTLPAVAKRPRTPPEERFWKRYSPHYELPLSVVVSVSLHVGVALVMIFGAAWFITSLDSPEAPPRIDLVEIMGGDPGIDGLGAGNTPLGGGAGKEKDAENVAENADSGKPATQRTPPTQVAALKDPLKAAELKFPETSTETPDPDGPGEAFSQLDKATKQAENDILNATKPTPPPPAGGTKAKGGKYTGNPKAGTGGPAGRGTGRGSGVGAGKGLSPYGQVLTDQRKRQMRWQILASPDGRIHLAKLEALNVTLVMPTRDPRTFTVFDLERKPIRPKQTTRLEAQGDKVWWTNRDPTEVQALARLLGLRETPRCFVIFLPKTLEERMLQLEEDFQGAREEQIEKTIWDVPLRDGRYAREPQVVQQILKARR